MYQNLINSLKKILDSKSTQAEKLLKIATLVDFADGLERPIPPSPQMYQPQMQQIKTEQKPNTLVDAKKPNAPGALVGVEDIK